MNIETANRLTGLFNGATRGVLLDFNKFYLEFITPRACEILINVETPELLCRYMNHILNSKDDLFGTYDMFRNGSPLKFRGLGWNPGIKTPSPLFEFQFYADKTASSSIAFQENFRDGGKQAKISELLDGPSALEFIAIMEQAGKDWSEVKFQPVRKRPSLRLVG